MKVTRIDTGRTDELPNLGHVLVHTDEGVTGRGETFFFADTVEAHIHDVVAEYLVGQDPGSIERHASALRGYVGAAASGAASGASCPRPASSLCATPPSSASPGSGSTGRGRWPGSRATS